jgi:transposase
MCTTKYRPTLTSEEREQLESLCNKGRSAARTQTRARILLMTVDGYTDEKIIEALGVSASMVLKTRQRCVEEGVEAALVERPRPGQRHKLTDHQCAHLIAVACSDAPVGHDHWTLRLLADKVVELGFAESFSHESVRNLLKKTL